MHQRIQLTARLFREKHLEDLERENIKVIVFEVILPSVLEADKAEGAALASTDCEVTAHSLANQVEVVLTLINSVPSFETLRTHDLGQDPCGLSE